MKTKKTIISAFIAIAILLATFSGCNLNGDTPNADQSELGEMCLGSALPFTIRLKDIDGTFKDEFVKQINNFKTMGRDNEDYWMEAFYKITDIPSFYSLDNLKIDGYRLYLVSVRVNMFSFKFVPDEQWDNEYVIVNNVGVISISIDRPGTWGPGNDSTEAFKGRLNQARRDASGRLTEDNLIYYPSHNEVSAQLGDTIFTVRTPVSFDIIEELSKHDFIDISEIDLPEDYEFVDEYAHLGTYESLRELAFRVIETAELVNVAEARAATERGQ